MSEKRQVKQAVVVETTPDMAFEAITKASELREWLSDEAWTEVRVDGRYDVRWNQGYCADGKFTEVDPPRRATVVWQGTGEPGKTVVEFSVKPIDDGVKVTVIHDGFGPGEEWDEAFAESEKSWATSLENLKSTLETGVDQRITRQPFLGIILDLLTPERAAKEGIAAERGIYVQNTVEGSGARAAGLGQSDVIASLGGVETLGFAELGAALRAHRAGDVVDVELVRGQKREIVQIALGSRPMPEMSDSAAELADRLAETVKEVEAELKAALDGVSDEEAGQPPAEGEWSAKQVLAHLSTGERGFHNILVNWAVNGWLDGGPISQDQIPGQLDAALAVTPMLKGLVERFLADLDETVALIRYLPDETVAHKARFRRITEAVLFGPDHVRGHIEQIKNAIEGVRGRSAG
jgi:uncharacterized protein YndB with AHSA1/START domain/uncharacterized damage-inducible protein DinB